MVCSLDAVSHYLVSKEMSFSLGSSLKDSGELWLDAYLHK